MGANGACEGEGQRRRRMCCGQKVSCSVVVRYRDGDRSVRWKMARGDENGHDLKA